MTWLPLVVMLLGLMVYMLVAHVKVAELGRISFAFGLLVTLWQLATRLINP